MSRVVQQRFPRMMCPPGVPAWSLAMEHAYGEMRAERKNGQMLVSEVEARAAELFVIPKLPVIIPALPL